MKGRHFNEVVLKVDVGSLVVLVNVTGLLPKEDLHCFEPFSFVFFEVLGAAG